MGVEFGQNVVTEFSEGFWRSKSAQNQNTDNNQDPNQSQNSNNTNSNIEYFKIPVAFEIQGNNLGYLKYRRALSRSKKVINFDTEKVNVNENGRIEFYVQGK